MRIIGLVLETPLQLKRKWLRALPAKSGRMRTEPASEDRKNGKSESPKVSKSATLSEKSLSRLIEALTDAIGPIAPLVVHEQIAALGESEGAFPKTRVADLLQVIEREITTDERARFQYRMPGEFRNLENQSK